MKGDFHAKLEKYEEENTICLWFMDIPGKRIGKSRGPEVGKSEECSRNSVKVHVPHLSKTKNSRERSEKERRTDGLMPFWPLQKCCFLLFVETGNNWGNLS